MITRDEFKALVKQTWHNTNDLSADDSPLWALEKATVIRPQWFACIKPINQRHAAAYWHWCDSHLSGDVLCYSSNTDDSEEWWGFTEKNDVLIWMLRWA